MHVHLQPEVVGQVTWGIDLVFEAERLDGYRLALVDPKYGTSWDDWSEEWSCPGFVDTQRGLR
jgi:hypothetical protein